MNNPIKYSRVLRFLIIFGFLFLGTMFFPSSVLSEPGLLREIIISYNQKALEISLENGSYRGEEGVLRIRPEVARAFGMKVFVDDHYLQAKSLLQKAEVGLEEAEKSMYSRGKETFPGQHAQAILDHFLTYKKNIESSKQKYRLYHSSLNQGEDDRLDLTLCRDTMDRLLTESLSKFDNRLRDALGHFFNVCQGVNKNSLPLTTDNVRFVNEVFNQFSQKAMKDDLKKFDLDRELIQKKSETPMNWEHVFGKRASRFAPLVDDTSKKFEERGYKVDPLLFMALMKRESNFKPRAVSPVGAAGLTQIMPKTGKDLGMKNIYEPAYLAKAFTLTKEERRTRGLAKKALFKIEGRNALDSAKKARILSQKALLLAKERERLFDRYKGELLKKQNDDRLQPGMAIEHGFRYFARLLKMQKGDISLALASYNAGPGRVTQYRGIPPYQETVLFRNRVLQYYRDFHRRANQLK